MYADELFSGVLPTPTLAEQSILNTLINPFLVRMERKHNNKEVLSLAKECIPQVLAAELVASTAFSLLEKASLENGLTLSLTNESD